MNITDKHLSKIFSDNIDYHISKIYEAIYHDDYQLEVAKVNIIYLKEIYLRFISGYVERYGSVENSAKLIKEKIDFIFNKYDEFILDGNFYENMEVDIYTDSFAQQFKEMQELAENIDENFTTNK